MRKTACLRRLQRLAKAAMEATEKARTDRKSVGRILSKANAAGHSQGADFTNKRSSRMPTKSSNIIYVGIDLHKDQITVVILNTDGSVIDKRRISCRAKHKIVQYFSALPRPWHAVVEAVGFYHWFWDLLEPLADRMILANATEVRNRAGSRPKTDYRDATWLAILLYEGRFDQDHHLRCFVPDPQLRGLREWTRCRHRLARKLRRDKVSFRRILLKNNLPGPKDLDGPHATAWLKAYEDKLSDRHRFMLRQLLDTILIGERQIADAERQIEDLIVSDFTWAHQAELLMSLPGVGLLTAATLIAEVGDWKRFDHVNEVVDYVGLAPRVFASDKTVRYGRMTKTGPRDARWILQQAAWVAIRHQIEIRLIWDRIRRRAGKYGKQKAAAAIARRLLVWAFFIIRSDEPFRRFTDKAA